MAEIDWKAVHRLEDAAASATRAADRIEESARRIGQQFEPGYGGNGERLIEALESVPQADEAAALRDMLESARSDLEVIRDALGVPVEPHQSLIERMAEAAQAKGDARRRGQFLLDVDNTAIKIPHPYGACDAIDNDGDPYQSQGLADELASLRNQGMFARCDGNHGGPRCADPGCWNDDAPIENGGDVMGGAA
jgi:hypothetical protein